MEDSRTFGEFILALPRRVGEEQALECDLDVRMVLSDPVEDGGRFFEGQDDEQMLRLLAAAHGEGGSQLGEAEGGAWMMNC